ncbi:thiamine pyrophosphate-binding protein [Patescibacteria group bacterium]|nr:thiamine pyrophosphate-binding protein [Patescibacteria group bacterium]
MKLSDYLVKHLEKITDSIFLVSGGGCMHTVDSIGKSQLDSYCCHHEQSCALAAEGYSRISNRIGVASVTTGPGGTNTITGVAAAWVDGIPMMIISGQVRKEIKLTREDIENGLRRLGEPQEINLLDVVKPITKYAVCVENPDEIKYHLEKACYLAKSGKPGPVWLEIPLDVQCAEIDENNLIGFEAPEKPKYNIPFKEIIEALNKAKKPLMIVGNGIRLAGAVPELWEFIKKTKINVVSAMSGTDLVNDDYPYYLGEQGLSGVETANYAFDNCDLLLIVGTRMQIRNTSFEYKKFAENAVKIMVDIDKAELYKRTLKIDTPVCVDAKDFLEGTLKQDIKLKRWDIEKKPVSYEANNKYVDAYQFLETLSGKCDYSVITSNGMVAETPHQALKLKKGQRLITNTAFGEMGKGLPMSIGACIANNKKPVICLEGDGSIMMNIQELQTVIYHKLPIKIFLFNNGGYYSIRNTHLKFFNKVFACDKSSGVGFPDWSKLAPAWGIKYESIKNGKDLDKIKSVLDFDGPIFCEVFIDPEQKKLPKWEAGLLKEK